MRNLAGQREGLIGGRYALHDEIASGGMATVHFGRLLGPAGFSRTVAVKRLHPQLAKEPEFVSMFIDEVRLAARIQHPNVVATIDVVEDANELFLVMEYVHGESLGRLIRLASHRGKPIPPAIAATVIAGVLHGLHAAHEAKSEHNEPLELVHRDVSPQNVLVGVDGVARVLDFGIAKAAGRLQTTRAGQIKGKMAYLAPEHVQGGPIDRRTDIYGASVVLWEALTAVQLFEGENDAIVLARVLAGQVPRPSEFASGIPPGLEAITLRGLDREPENRFGTAREMALALQQQIGIVAAHEVGEWVAELAETSLAARARYMTDLERMAVRDHRASSNAPVAMPVPPTLLSEAERRRDRANDGPSTRPVNPPGLAEAAQRDAAAKEAANVEKAKEEVAPREGDAPVNPVSSSVDGESAWLALRRSSKRRLALAGGGLFVAGLATVVGIVRARASGPRVTAIEEPVILVSPALTTSTPIDSPVEEAPATPEVAVPAEGEHSEQHAAKTSAPSAAPRRATTVSVIEGGRGPRIVRPPLAKVISSADAARAVAAPTTPTPKNGDTRRNCHPPYVVDAAGIKRFKVECL